MVAGQSATIQAIMPRDIPLVKILNSGFPDGREEILACVLIGQAEGTGNFPVVPLDLRCLTK